MSDSESAGGTKKKKRTWDTMVRTATNLKHIMGKKETNGNHEYR